MKETSSQDGSKRNSTFATDSDFFDIDPWPIIGLGEGIGSEARHIEWSARAFNELLIDRSIEERRSAIEGLKHMLTSALVPQWCTTKYRALQNATVAMGSINIQGFPNAKEHELFALLGLLQIADLCRTARSTESSGHRDQLPVESLAQIMELQIHSEKMFAQWIILKESGEQIGKTFEFGGKMESGRKASLAAIEKNEPNNKLRKKVEARYLDGVKKKSEKKFGEWKSQKDAARSIFKEMVVGRKGLGLTESNGENTIYKWIREVTIQS